MHPIILSMRPSFLLLTMACVCLGLASAHYVGAKFSPLFYWVIAGALLAHIAVNMLNEYHDFKSGLDMLTDKTPFSGGSGALIAAPQYASHVRVLGWISVFAVVLIGVHLVSEVGLSLLPIGLLGLVVVVLYTPVLNKNPWACLVAPGAGFGLMVLGSAWVLTPQLSGAVGFVALIVFFLVNNLLLLNQLPDARADVRIGRRHLVISHGSGFAVRIYGLSVAATALVLALAVDQAIFPPVALVVLPLFGLGVYSWCGARLWGEEIATQVQYLAANVALSLLLPIALAAVLFLA